MKKYIKLFLVALVAFAIKATTAYAANTHEFSLKAYDCNKMNEYFQCIDDNNQVITNFTELANNAYVTAGQVIRLDVMYVPGPTPDVMMQIAFSYDPALVTPVHTAADKIYIYKGFTTVANGGNYPGGDTPFETSWILNGNDDIQNQKLRFLLEDNNAANPMTVAGRLFTVYVTINEDVTLDQAIPFVFDQKYTKMANKEARSFTDLSLKGYVVLDSDTSLSAINVTSGGVTYPVKEAIAADRTTYHVYVPNNVSSVNIEGIATKLTTNVTGDDSLTLSVSTNATAQLLATAQSGATQLYNVIVYRLSNNANLSSLSLSNVDFGTFNANTINYTATVPYTTTSTNVSATAADSKATLSYTSNKSLNVGDNNVTVTVNPENCKSDYNSVPGNTCTPKTYTVKVTRTAASTINTLSDLKVDNESVPNFSPDTLTYTLNDVDYTKGSVNITYTKGNEFETVTGDGTQTLNVGNNALKVTVKSQSGVDKVYTINIKRKSNDSTLKSLSVTSTDGSLDKAFNPATLEYTYTVGPDVTSVTVAGTKNHSGATVSNSVTVNPLTTNKVEVLVTAEDTNYSTTYTVNIVRTKSNNADLSALSVTGYTLNETFNADTLDYTLTVPSNVESVQVNATRADTRASMEGDGTLTLTIGNNNVATIHVVAENQTTTKDYTITVTRQNNDATLKTLALTNVDFGDFNPATNSYTVTVPYTTSSTTVSAAVNDTKAIAEYTANKNLAVGENTIEVLVKAEDRSVTNTYTVKVTRTAASTINTLSDLKVDNESVPNFSPDTLTYTLNDVDYTKGSVNITYTKGNEFETVTGDGTQTLNVGNNALKVTVKSQSGVDKVYTINIKRKSNDSTLKSLSVTSTDGSLDKAFNPATLEYTYTVGPDVTSVTVEGVENYDGASVSGNATVSPLTTNKVELVVTAEDTNYSTTYTVNIVRTQSSNSSLSGLSIDGYDINPQFDEETTEYTLTVPSTVETINVVADKDDDRQDIDGDGEHTLTVGENEIVVKVTAEDQTYTEYTIKVTKLNNDATLKTLALTNVDFGEFNPASNSYTVTVPYTTSTTTITAVPNDTKAIAEFDENKTLAVGENTIEVLVKAEDRNVTNTYTVVVTREAASTNANLASLKVNGVSVPNFDKNTLEYTLEDVANDVASVNVTATAEEANAQITGDGDRDLVVGNNTLEVKVVSQSNDELTYKIYIKRLSNDSTLKSLSVTSDEGSLDKEFNPATLEYTYTAGPDVTEIVIEGVANHDEASVDGNNTYDPNTTSQVLLKVTAEDESYTEYKINLVRTESSNSKLSDLSIEGYTIDPEFDPDVTEYTLTVPEGTTSISIIASEDDDRADIDGDGEHQLTVGENEITVTVTAEDDTTTEYVIKVTVPESSDNTLSDLTVNGETIDGFRPEITEYDLGTVPNDTDSIVIGATENDPDADVDGTGTIPLTTGENTITVTVTAPNGETQDYVITVTRAENDNNYLSSLSIDGIVLNENFDKTNQAYTANIPANVTTLNISATPEVETSRVTGKGEVTITEDETVITVTCTSQSGVGREYTITVTKVIEDEFITSIEYGHTIDDTYILTANLNATVLNMKDELDNDNSKLEVWDAKEEHQLTDEDYIATGYVVKLMINGVEKDRKLIVIKGDTNGDGTVTLVDAVAVSYHYVKLNNPDSEKKLLLGAYEKAAYVNDDENITLIDAVAISYHYVHREGNEIDYKTKYTR